MSTPPISPRENPTTHQETKIKPEQALPPELFQYILSFLNNDEIEPSSSVSKQWSANVISLVSNQESTHIKNSLNHLIEILGSETVVGSKKSKHQDLIDELKKIANGMYQLDVDTFPKLKFAIKSCKAQLGNILQKRSIEELNIFLDQAKMMKDTFLIKELEKAKAFKSFEIFKNDPLALVNVIQNETMIHDEIMPFMEIWVKHLPLDDTFFQTIDKIKLYKLGQDVHEIKEFPRYQLMKIALQSNELDKTKQLINRSCDKNYSENFHLLMLYLSEPREFPRKIFDYLCRSAVLQTESNSEFVYNILKNSSKENDKDFQELISKVKSIKKVESKKSAAISFARFSLLASNPRALEFLTLIEMTPVEREKILQNLSSR